MTILVVNLGHHVGRVFLEGEDEEGPELKGLVTSILCFRGEFSSERFRELLLAH